LLPGDVFYRLGNAPKSFSALALPRTSLGSLQRSSDLLAGGEEPQPASALRAFAASALRASLSGRPKQTPKISLSYGIVVVVVYFVTDACLLLLHLS